MPNNIDDKVGLQFCYWKINDKLHQPEKAGSYVMNVNDSHEFFVNDHCIGGKTRNPQSTITNARWAFIYNVFFRSIQDKPEIEITENLWGNLSGGTQDVSKYALGTRYKQASSLTFQPSGESYYYGFKQRIELFSQSPGTGFFFFVIPYTEPNISYAYFKNSEEVKRYGESANLTVMFHGYNFDENYRYKAKVYLLALTEAKGLTTTKQFEENNLWEKPVGKDLDARDSSDNSNIYIRHNFNINVEWKKGQEGNKEFTVAVEVYRAPYSGRNSEKWERFHYRNFETDPTSDLVSYDAELLKLEDVDQKASTSSRFIVSDELMSDYLFRINEERNNQIQYIGDIPYTNRQYDPCGYSKITIKDESDSGRDSLIIFDEEDTTNPIDRTDKFFGIITGDERKKISITVDKLVTTEDSCQSLLLTNGEKHTTFTNLFQIGNVITAMRDKNGRFVEIPDSSQKDDTDVQADSQRGPSENVAETQQWRNGVDYEQKSETSIQLNLRYIYNKTVAEASGAQNIVTDLFWIFRYIWPNENQAQIYYLPVSTCRYPNQIAKIKVYPDVEWEIALSYNYSNPLGYNHGNLTTYNVEGTMRRYEGLSQQEYNLQTQQATLGQFKLGLFNPKVNGNDLIKTEFEFAEKIRKVCAVFYTMKKIADRVTYGTEGGADLLRAKKFPFDFEIKSPSAGIKISWANKTGSASENKHKVGLEGSLDWYASPLIGADLTLKIHELIKYIPHPLAKIVDGIITGFNKLSGENVETKFEVNLVFSGELNANINAFQINVLDTQAQLAAAGNQKSYVEGVFTVKLEVILLGKGKITIPWTSYEFNFGAKAEAYLKAYWDAKLFLTNQKEGLYGQFSGGFSGLKGKIIVEIIVGPMTFTIYDAEDTWFEPDDANPESDVTNDNGQKPLMLPIIEAAK